MKDALNAWSYGRYGVSWYTFLKEVAVIAPCLLGPYVMACVYFSALVAFGHYDGPPNWWWHWPLAAMHWAGVLMGKS
ncbi:MAG TPA: hypothetical protein P5328_01375 [Candidatus Paceibacterota bacterium]|nr:hypothetical protein [Candidatus Paceibacterota bacterium]HRZ34712.1 hypothetical protein [Candidatus Paceibacterota bacterium]